MFQNRRSKNISRAKREDSALACTRQGNKPKPCWYNCPRSFPGNAVESSSGCLVGVLPSKVGVQSGRGWSPTRKDSPERNISTLHVRRTCAEETSRQSAGEQCT